MRVSVVMPVFNEVRTIDEIIRRVLSQYIVEELIIIDDFSTDGTRSVLSHYKDNPAVQVYHHHKNLGKGAAIRTALRYVAGDIVIIQDADLEYSPMDYNALLAPIYKGDADVVNGSRFIFPHLNKSMRFWHVFNNKVITLLSNIANNIYLTDVASCLKAFNRRALRHLEITCDDFRFEVEFIENVVRNKMRIYEVPISYDYRTSDEGKKLCFLDGIKCALWICVSWSKRLLRLKTKDALCSKNGNVAVNRY